jgi:ferredoxin
MVKMVKIKVHTEKCGDPLECRLCLEKCPATVFVIWPKKKRGINVRPANWIIEPVMISKCTACNLCVEIFQRPL